MIRSNQSRARTEKHSIHGNPCVGLWAALSIHIFLAKRPAGLSPARASLTASTTSDSDALYLWIGSGRSPEPILVPTLRGPMDKP
jgi:hypothetical protein